MSNYHLRNVDYKLPNPIYNYPLGHFYLSIANYLLPFFHFQIQRGGKRCDPNSMDASGVDSPQQVSLLKPCLSICIFLVFLPYIQLDEIDPPQQVGILHLKYNTLPSNQYSMQKSSSFFFDTEIQSFENAHNVF